MIHLARLFVVIVAVPVVAVTSSKSTVTGFKCGPADRAIAIAGSETVLPITQIWAEWYMQKCSSINVTIQGGSSTKGAQRVCGDAKSGAPVDIGAMSRPWHPTEAIVDMFNGTMQPHRRQGTNFTYQCVIGNTRRKTIQIEVGIEAVAVALINGGLAAQCLRKTSGLTVAQLRWMYSNISEAAQGLGSSIPINEIIPNSDGNATTKKWSELSVTCPEANIQIAGADLRSGTTEFFRQALGFVAGEGFATNRPGGYFSGASSDDIVTFLSNSSLEVYGDAIAFVDMRFYLERGSLLYGVPVRNAAGVYTAPTRISVEENVYNPLSRRLYLQVLNDEASLANTKPFIDWGLSNTASALLDETPFLDLPLEQRLEMKARLGIDLLTEFAPKLPTRAPNLDNCVDEPLIAVDYNCGLLNLNFLCLRGCGFFRRLLGFCEDYVEVPITVICP